MKTNRHIIILILFIFINLLKAEPGDNINHSYNYALLNSRQYFSYKSDSIITEHYSHGNNFSLFNNNVNFSNKNHTYNSLLKMSAEALSGGILGFALGSVIYNTFKPKVKGEGAAIGKLIQLAFTMGAVDLGITNGVYYFGKLLGDEGEFRNMRFWMVLSGVVAYGLAQTLTSNENTRIWAMVASLPIGATFGFNTNDLAGWIFPEASR